MPALDRAPVIDPWSFFDHKVALNPDLPGRSVTAPTWVNVHHHRRLMAYLVCRAYAANVARYFLAVDDEAAINERREFGDAALLIASVRAAVLGNAPTLGIDGAEDEPAEDLPEDDDADEDLDPEGLEDALDEDEPDDDERLELEQEWADFEAARDRQEWLDAWVDAEHAVRTILEVEDDAGTTGDGVFVVQWRDRTGRPWLRVFDPESYFPVYEPGHEDEYPLKVHFAWAEEHDPETIGGDPITYVRRITYELITIDEALEDGVELDHPGAGRVTTSSGEAVRAYPYQDDPSPWVCLQTEGLWRFDDLDDRLVDTLSDDKAEWVENDEGIEIVDLDTGLDFIPVVHTPNTNAVKQPWGRATIALGAQVLDELAAADTDLSAAAATSGTPMVAVAGAPVGDTTITYGPGSVARVGEGGRLDVVDTTKGVTTLIEYRRHLERVLSSSTRVPEAALGRIDPSKVEAGIILALSFGPFAGLVDEMRLVRSEKYALLVKMVQRIAIVNGALEGPVLAGGIRFGSYLPSDRGQVVELVAKLAGASGGRPIITRKTALALLNEAGIVDLEDIAAEADAAMAEDVQYLVGFLDATGDSRAVRDRAGLAAQAPPSTRPEDLPAPGGVTIPSPGAVPPGGPPAPTPPVPTPPAT